MVNNNFKKEDAVGTLVSQDQKNHALVNNAQQETIDLVDNQSFKEKDAPGAQSTNVVANIGTHKYNKIKNDLIHNHSTSNKDLKDPDGRYGSILS